MKTLKLLQAGIATLLLAILIGCSDSITSTFTKDTQVESSSVNEYEEGLPIVRDAYSVQIRLKPRQSVTFQASEIGLSSITSFSVDRVPDEGRDSAFDPCGDLRISGNDFLESVYLKCHEQKVDLTSLTIKNIGSEFVTLNIEFGGLKVKGKEVRAGK